MDSKIIECINKLGYDVIYKKSVPYLGLTNMDTKVITINSKLKNKNLTEILIHELTHVEEFNFSKNTTHNFKWKKRFSDNLEKFLEVKIKPENIKIIGFNL